MCADILQFCHTDVSRDAHFAIHAPHKIIFCHTRVLRCIDLPRPQMTQRVAELSSLRVLFLWFNPNYTKTYLVSFLRVVDLSLDIDIIDRCNASKIKMTHWMLNLGHVDCIVQKPLEVFSVKLMTNHVHSIQLQ